MKVGLRSITASLFIAAVLLAGCGREAATDESRAAVSTANGTSYNGTSYNGTSYNGTSYNGVSYNGVSYNGVSYNGASYNGISLNGVSYNGASYNGVSYNGVSYNGVSHNGSSLAGVQLVGSLLSARGGGVVGAELQARGEIGGTLAVQLRGLSFGEDENRDLWYYDLVYRQAGEDRPLCGFDPLGKHLRATFVAGVWDTRSGVDGGGRYDPAGGFTIACKGSTIEKCMRLGYKPWRTVNGESLLPYLLACVRMLRADYCGDGQSWTVNGRKLDVWDAAGVQSPLEDWIFDAEWSEDGATCVSHPRVHWSVGPSCLPDKADASCGQAGFRPGVRTMDEFESELEGG